MEVKIEIDGLNADYFSLYLKIVLNIFMFNIKPKICNCQFGRIFKAQGVQP